MSTLKEDILAAFLADRERALQDENPISKADFFARWGDEMTLSFTYGYWSILLRDHLVPIPVDVVIRLISTPLVTPPKLKCEVIYEDNEARAKPLLYWNGAAIAECRSVSMGMADSDANPVPSGENPPAKVIDPNNYESSQEFLKALGYTENAGYFTKGDHKIPFDAMRKRRPRHIAELIKRETE